MISGVRARHRSSFCSGFSPPTSCPFSSSPVSGSCSPAISRCRSRRCRACTFHALAPALVFNILTTSTVSAGEFGRMAAFYLARGRFGHGHGPAGGDPAPPRPRFALRIPARRRVLEQRQLRAAGGAAGLRPRRPHLRQRLLRVERHLQLHRRHPAGRERPALGGAGAGRRGARARGVRRGGGGRRDGVRAARARRGGAPDGAAERRRACP